MDTAVDRWAIATQVGIIFSMFTEVDGGYTGEALFWSLGWAVAAQAGIIHSMFRQVSGSCTGRNKSFHVQGDGRWFLP